MSLIVDAIKEECSDFLTKSGGLPLIKTLLANEDKHVRKVKVRTKKTHEQFIDTFNSAFEEEHKNIYGRSIFCNGPHSSAKEGHERVYVFPINGFKFLFNPNVNYHEEYNKSLEKVKSATASSDVNILISDMIKYSYDSCNYTLEDAIFSSKEVIIYNIPYYYAIRGVKHPNYGYVLKELLGAFNK